MAVHAVDTIGSVDTVDSVDVVGSAGIVDPVNSADSKRLFKDGVLIIAALFLLACLMIVIAISVSTIAFANSEDEASARKEAGIIMAANIAEQFAADPSSLQETYAQDDYTAACSCDVSADDAGSMYKATIVIKWKDEEIYSLKTSKYVSHSDEKSLGDFGSDDRRVM